MLEIQDHWLSVRSINARRTIILMKFLLLTSTRLPTKQIFVCTNGHFVLCYPKAKLCPTIGTLHHTMSTLSPQDVADKAYSRSNGQEQSIIRYSGRQDVTYGVHPCQFRTIEDLLLPVPSTRRESQQRSWNAGSSCYCTSTSTCNGRNMMLTDSVRGVLLRVVGVYVLGTCEEAFKSTL